MPPNDDDQGSSTETNRLAEITHKKSLLIQERKQLIAQVRDLDYRIALLSTEYGKIHNAAHPISKIPSDILHLIFHLVIDSEPIPTPRPPEMILSAVCAQWRHACLSFGDIWNTFRTRHPSKRAHERLVAVLQRSGSYPLDLWFDFREVGFHDLPDRFHLLRDSLLHVRRWRRLTIITDVESPLHYLSERLVETAAPLLERLTLLPNRAYEFDEVIMTTDEPVTLTGGTPNLTYLCLNDLSAAMFTPTLSTITDLRLDMTEGIENFWIQWDVFLQILQLPSLVTLSLVGQPFTIPPSLLRDAISSADGPFEPPTITMPNLRHLRHASLLATGFVDLILPNLDAPNLLTLTLKDLNKPFDPETYWTNNPNTSKSSRKSPFPNLHTLVLIDYEFFIDTVFTTQLSSLTSNITQLVISDGCEALGQFMTRHDPLPGGWNKIKSFALNVRTGVDYSFGSHLRSFVHLRKEHLKTLYLPQAFLSFWKFESSKGYDQLGEQLRAIENVEGCRVVAWTRKEEVADVDGCLGPGWPPGSSDNDGVDDPMSFDLCD